MLRYKEFCVFYLKSKYLSHSYHGPMSTSDTSSVRTTTKVNRHIPSRRRPALLCWHGMCAGRPHGRWATHRSDSTSFTEGNCTGAKWCTFMMRFFFPFSVPGLLKPWFVYLLDRTTLTGTVQTYTSMSALSTNGRWHSQTICWPFSSAPHAQAWNNMTLRWSKSLNMLQTKAEVRITIFMVGLWARWNPLGSFSVSNLFHNIKKS